MDAATQKLSYAKKLRKNQSDAENRLWFLLRNRRLCTFKFKRQYIIEPYIVDFICLQKRLIIELDGGQHAAQIKYDQARTHFLESKGFQVLRFWNDDVLSETDLVLEEIFRQLNK